MQAICKAKHKIVGGSMAFLTLAAVVGIAAYRTHTEPDSALFFKAYPQVLGTRLDGCETCHSRIESLPPGEVKGNAVKLSSCDSCHQITDYGRKQGNTLTPYGHEYRKAGRNAAAFAAIAKLDSDRDGWSNAAELDAKTNPGDPLSTPDKKLAPHIVISYDDLVAKKIPILEQAIFVNVTKSKDGDSYSDLKGFKLIDVLEAAGMNREATSVDVISLDGFSTTFSINQLRRKYRQAPPEFGLGADTLGECGWVRYGARNLKAGVPLPDANVLLTFAVNRKEYPPASINDQQRLQGSGPFRIVAPQMKNPGMPDNSSRATEACIAKVPEKYRYNSDFEKNSDYCVKAVVALRVNPLPTGTIDIHWPQYAGKAIEGKNIVIFGALKQAKR
ncbi:MAG: hypothetical protein JXA73_06380 [Acidobacteria bacterium]|nr:hypothetical protein [Acidobacteriota bacterium]